MRYQKFLLDVGDRLVDLQGLANRIATHGAQAVVPEAEKEAVTG